MFNKLSHFRDMRNIFWMVSIAVGIVAITVGLTLMYILPPYIIDVFNDTGLFTAESIAEANTAIDGIQAFGFLIIMIGLIWVVIGIISRGQGATK